MLRLAAGRSEAINCSEPAATGSANSTGAVVAMR
jgi:hypothetical protein